MEMWIEI